MMLGMLRQFNRLLTELQCAARMASRIGAPADLFLHLRIFNHALQNARPAHQNVILLLFTQLVRRGRFFLGALKISAIQVDVRGIQVDRAGAMMVRTLLIDGPGGLQVLQRFAAKLSQAAAIVMLRNLCSASGLAVRGWPASSGAAGHRGRFSSATAERFRAWRAPCWPAIAPGSDAADPACP